MMSDIVERLRGKYPNGPIMENGKPEFGYRYFENRPPIQEEAAQAITALTAEITRLNQEIDALHAEIGHKKASVVDRDAVIRECAKLATYYIIEGNSIHPDVEFENLNKDAKAIAHTTCQHVSHAILALIEQEGK
jgi:uncharacterized small protein (DUF1192 family)